ncbi:hypothetical protein E2C01_045843 [Portunus trituberculatus]|uniref:Uncharacterized protein n=1 Tax=Portunus trituberculatus TaxID=210409 RepID=A0A5B7G628_PORTR|nr:hypothetical protein [Portunus trituberculatus]
MQLDVMTPENRCSLHSSLPSVTRRYLRVTGRQHLAAHWMHIKEQLGPGAVARVTHGGQGSAPPSPQLSSSRSADNTPKKNISPFLYT